LLADLATNFLYPCRERGPYTIKERHGNDFVSRLEGRKKRAVDNCGPEGVETWRIRRSRKQVARRWDSIPYRLVSLCEKEAFSSSTSYDVQFRGKEIDPFVTSP
jgi:hypothetical protein